MFQGSIAQHGLMPEEWINIRILYFKRGPEFSNIYREFDSFIRFNFMKYDGIL